MMPLSKLCIVVRQSAFKSTLMKPVTGRTIAPKICPVSIREDLFYSEHVVVILPSFLPSLARSFVRPAEILAIGRAFVIVLLVSLSLSLFRVRGKQRSRMKYRCRTFRALLSFSAFPQGEHAGILSDLASPFSGNPRVARPRVWNVSSVGLRDRGSLFAFAKLVRARRITTTRMTRTRRRRTRALVAVRYTSPRRTEINQRCCKSLFAPAGSPQRITS